MRWILKGPVWFPGGGPFQPGPCLQAGSSHSAGGTSAGPHLLHRASALTVYSRVPATGAAEGPAYSSHLLAAGPLEPRLLGRKPKLCDLLGKLQGSSGGCHSVTWVLGLSSTGVAFPLS